MAYSPTMMRWMQQDPMGYVEGASLYDFVVDSPISRNDSNGYHSKLSYKTVGKSGGYNTTFSWDIKWDIVPASEKGGWIVQVVDESLQVWDSHKVAQPTPVLPGHEKDYPLREGWSVDAGKTTANPTISPTTGQAVSETWDDHWTPPKLTHGFNEKAAIGKLVITATAFFIEGCKVPMFNTVRSASKDPPPSGILPTISNWDLAWTLAFGDLQAFTTASQRTLEVDWDNTAGLKPNVIKVDGVVVNWDFPK